MKTLNVFYRLWRALATPEPEQQYPPLKTVIINARREGKTLSHEQCLITHYESTIEVYREALRPFARMHREVSRKNMIVAERQFGDRTEVIRESDFDRAFYLLDEHNI